MKRIIIHWNAGQNTPNADDFEHYHFMYGNGLIVVGKYKPEDNLNTNDGKYAAHTGGYNTNSIGVAFCGMLGFNSQTKKTPYPIQKQDFENGCKHIAELAKKYNIQITSDLILTHYEVGQSVKQNKIKRTPLTSANLGKIDIIYLPFYPNVSAEKMGNFIRDKIQWYYDKL